MSCQILHHQPKVGIEAVDLYTPENFFSLQELAEVRGVEYAKYRVGLGCEQMAVMSPWDDPVTMGATAGARVLERSGVSTEEIGMVLVATESAVDESKPIAIYIHELLDLPRRCRVWDIRNACYASTAALRSALEWVRSPAAQGRKALVIATDVAYYDLGSSGEPTQGAAAVALLVSQDPKLLVISMDHDAVYSNEVMDFWRPSYRNSALVDGHFSLECYLEGLKHTYQDYLQATQLTYSDFNHFLFHTPFPKMARKAHQFIHSLGGDTECAGEEQEFEARVAPSLLAAQKIGNVYSASLYMAFLSLLEFQKVLPGERVGLYSYGSGSSAEFFSGTLGKGVGDVNFNTGLTKLITRRKQVSYEQYQLLRAASEMRMRDGSYTQERATQERPFVYQGIKNHKRQYALCYGVRKKSVEQCSSLRN